LIFTGDFRMPRRLNSGFSQSAKYFFLLLGAQQRARTGEKHATIHLHGFRF